MDLDSPVIETANRADAAAEGRTRGSSPKIDDGVSEEGETTLRALLSAMGVRVEAAGSGAATAGDVGASDRDVAADEATRSTRSTVAPPNAEGHSPGSSRQGRPYGEIATDTSAPAAEVGPRWASDDVEPSRVGIDDVPAVSPADQAPRRAGRGWDAGSDDPQPASDGAPSVSQESDAPPATDTEQPDGSDDDGSTTDVDRNDAPDDLVLASGGTVAEDAASGTAVASFAGSDADADAVLTYSLVDDAGGRFVIDPATGIVTLAPGAGLDHETAATHGIVVRVTDQHGASTDLARTIAVADRNDAPDDLVLASGGTVAEDAASGTAVASFAGSDADADAVLTYSLVDDAGGRFVIDPATGIVTLAPGAGLDHETAATHGIVVRVTDQHGASTDLARTIAVADRNDAPDDLVLASGGTVAEDAASGTAVASFAGSDADADAVLTYSLVDDAGGRFVIDPATGIVTLAPGAGLDHETAATHGIVVRVTDQHGASTDLARTIAVADRNDAPDDLVLASGGTVAEDAASGTVVASFAGSDADADAVLTYSLVDDAGGRFVIDPATGIVTLAPGAGLDHETAATHGIVVRVTDQHGASTDLARTIAVADRNDAPDDLVLASGGTVAEDAASGTAVASFAGSDADADAVLTYSLVDDAGGRFVIDPVSGVVTLAPGAGLDHETAASHGIVVRVTDQHGASTDLARTIAVADRNDAPDDLVLASGGTVAEDAASGTAVASFAGSDADADAVLTYSLVDDAGGRFVIDPVSGVVTLAPGAGLDHETAASHGIVVRVTDQHGASTDLARTIAVADRNDAPDDLVLASGGTVAEDAASGTAVASFAGSDADADAVLTYSLVDDAGGRFVIDPATGIVTLAPGAGLDHETAATHGIVVRVTDQHGASTDLARTIAVADRNDAPDDLVLASGGTVAEDAASGTAVASFAGSDADADAVLTYSLVDDAGGRFVIDPATGIVTLAPGAGLDHETAATHGIVVRVTDQHGASTDLARTIAVADRNDAPDDLVLASGGTVAEDAASGTAVASFAGSDADADAVLTYSLVDDAGGRFVIDPATGIVTLAPGAGLDHEAAATHGIVVRVTDQHGASTDLARTIAVADRNDAPDDLVLASGGTVAEDAASGTAVASFAGSDADADAVLTYSLLDDAGGRFVIDPATGIVTLAPGAGLDHETAATHGIVVRVTDQHGASTDLARTIAVADRNDAPDDLVLASGGTVAEDAASGTAVASFAGSDADADAVLTYSLVDDAGGRFVIDPVSGVVTLAPGAGLDHETAASHGIVVRVTDQHGASTDLARTIAVADRNDAPDDLVLASGGTVAEDAASGTAVASFAGSDADADAVLTYSLVDDAGGRFVIDPATGIVTLAPGAGLDHETAATHGIVVRVTDQHGASTDLARTIAVADRNDAPDDLVLASGGTVAEDAASGTAVASFAGSDADADAVLTYSLVDDAGGRFVIDPATGIVTLAPGAGLDHETAATHGIVVRVTDQHGASTDLARTIAVADRNDAPDDLVLASGGTVAEDAASGTAVASFAGSDADADAVLTYSLVDDAGGRFAIDPTSGQITVADATLLDHEQDTSHGLVVRATDADGLSLDLAITITVSDVGEGPSFTSGTTASVAENSTGTVYDAAATSAQPGTTVTFSLSGADAGAFDIDPATGVVTFKASPDWETPADADGNNIYTIDVVASDGTESASQAVTVTVTDVNGETLVGTSDADVLTGGSGDDTITGNAGNDVLTGGADADTLTGGADNDTLEGGAGSDLAVFTGTVDQYTFSRGASGELIVTDTVPARDGIDTLTGVERLTFAGATYNLVLGDDGDNASLTAPDGSPALILGFGSNDALTGGSGADAIVGGDGNDAISSGGGADVLAGGSGTDTLSYAGSGSAVTVDLANNSASGGDAQGDSISGFENLTGSGSNDALTGDAAANVIDGGSGDDTITGGGGADTLTGGTGFDTLSYAGSGAVTVDLSTSTASGNDAQGDVISGFENVTGGSSADSLTGSSSANAIDGGSGDDTIQGGGGADTLTGGTGSDTLSYTGSGSVTVDLSTNTVSGNDAQGDVVSGFENVAGGSSADVLTGDGNANVIDGGGGNDAIDAGGGADTLAGGAGSDTVIGGTGNDIVAGDNLLVNGSFEAGRLTAGNAAMGLSTHTGWSAITGGEIEVWNGVVGVTASDGSQNLEIDSRGAIDGLYQDVRTVAGQDYSFSLDVAQRPTTSSASNVFEILWNGVVVATVTPTSTSWTTYTTTMTGTGGLDRLTIRETSGANNHDGGLIDNAMLVATGSVGGNDLIQGGDGNDTLAGDAGDDTLQGGLGTDYITGGFGNDLIEGGAGADSLWGGSGADTLSYAGSSAVTVDLSTNTASGNDAQGDSISGFENLVGGSGNDSLTGDGSANIIDGGTGNDTIQGGGGADTLTGGIGTDTLSYAGSGAVTVNLSTSTVSGNDAQGDVISGFENVTGGSSADVLTGDASANVIDGGSGDDTIQGAAGADTLTGGSGSDTLSYTNSGSAVTVNLGNNSASGGDAQGDVISGFENVTGSDGDDVLTGYSSSNRLDGGAGKDTIQGGAGADTLTGGSGTDTLSYTNSSNAVTVNLATNSASGGNAQGDSISGFENLTGGSGNDTLTGDGNTNTIDGGSGDDTLDGGAGDDVMVGGGGTNTFWGGSGADVIDGSGSDSWNEIRYDNSATAVTVNLATGTGSGAGSQAEGDSYLGEIGGVYASTHADTLIGGDNWVFFIGGAGADRLEAGSGGGMAAYWTSSSGVTVNLETGVNSGGDAQGDVIVDLNDVYGSWSADVLTGDSDANTIAGGGGNDVIFGGAGTDYLLGEDGDDTIEGGTGADALSGGSGTDTLSYAGSSNAVTVNIGTNSASGGDAQGDTISGFDNVTGSDGNDVLTGDGNANRLDGGNGNDTIQGGAGADTLIGGAGTDTASYASATSGVTVSLATGTGTGGDAQGDTLAGFENLTGGSGGDTLTGDGTVNVIDGGSGNDTIQGGGGADTLAGGTGSDTLSYSASSAVTVDLATNSVSGGDAQGDVISGFENATGGSGNDVLTGDGNANRLDGGSGNDILTGADGDDTLTGGAGADQISGGTGTDTASYAAATPAITVNLKDSIYSGGDAQGDTLSGIENVVGGSGNDTLTGTTSANVLRGGAGNDWIDGEAGADLIEGGAGGDTLIGGSDADTLSYEGDTSGVTVDLSQSTASGGHAQGDQFIGFENILGGSGGDRLTGDSGRNVIDGGSGNDVIEGLGNGDTLIGGSGTDTLSYAQAGRITINLSTGLGAGNEAEGDIVSGFENVTGSINDDTITGDGNANVLDGGAGNDRLDAGLGDDTLVGGTGADTLIGGTGSDTASYAAATSAVTVSLASGTGSGSDAQGDTLSGIENLVGGSGNDVLTGDGNANRLDGGSGNDTIQGGAGADTLIGGTGTDTLSYTAGAAVTIDLGANTASGNDAQGDVISGFENLVGGSGADVLTGSSSSNVIDGGSGDDTIKGGGGADTLTGGTGSDTLSYTGSGSVTVDLSTNTVSGNDAQGDVISGFENVTGGSSADVLTGDGGANTFTGGGGADLISGGAGTDTAIYSGASSNFRFAVDASSRIVVEDQGGNEGTDRLTGIESLRFSDATVTIRAGTAGADTLVGGADSDLFVGGAGADVQSGGAGSDFFAWSLGQGNDRIDGGAGWTDQLHLSDADGVSSLGTFGVDWTLQLTSGSILSQSGDRIDLSADAAGTITVTDGSEEIAFQNLERVSY